MTTLSECLTRLALEQSPFGDSVVLNDVSQSAVMADARRFQGVLRAALMRDAGVRGLAVGDREQAIGLGDALPAPGDAAVAGRRRAWRAGAGHRLSSPRSSAPGASVATCASPPSTRRRAADGLFLVGDAERGALDARRAASRLSSGAGTARWADWPSPSRSPSWWPRCRRLCLCPR